MSGQGVDSDAMFTIDATPGLYRDFEGGSAVATLTFVPRLRVLTGYEHAGAELVDAVLSELLAHGFSLVSDLSTLGLLGLPAPPGWTATLQTRTGELQLDAGPLDYTGDIGPSAPTDWSATATQLGTLAVLVSTGVDLHAVDRSAQIDRARGDGRLIGA